MRWQQAAAIKSPLSLLFLRLNKSSSLRLTSHPLCSSPQPSWWLLLDSIQNATILLALGSPETRLSTPGIVSQVSNRREDPFPGLAGYMLAALPRVHLASFAGRAHWQITFNLSSRTLRKICCRAASHTVSPKIVQLHGMIPNQLQEFALAFAHLSEVPSQVISPIWPDSSEEQPCSTL